MTIKELERKALSLKPLDKIHLIEQLLVSLDQPDSKIEKVWIKESEARADAYERGDLKVISYAVLKKHLKRQRK